MARPYPVDISTIVLPEVPGYRSRPNPDKESYVHFLWEKEDGTPVCSALRHSCRKCQRKYVKGERGLHICPACGESRFCRTVVPTPSNRCRMHGGTALRGSAHPHFLDGRHSKYMPVRLRERYLAALGDPELLNLRQEISLLDSRITDLLGRVDAGDSGRLFEQARDAFRGFRDALDRGDSETMRIHLQTLDRVLAQGHGDFAAWEDIRATLETRRKLVDTEVQRMTKMGQIITAEDMQNVLHAVASIAKRVIKQPEVLNEFVAEVLALGAARPR